MGKASRRKWENRIERLENTIARLNEEAEARDFLETYFPDEDHGESQILGWSFGGCVDGEYVEYSEDFI